MKRQIETVGVVGFGAMGEFMTERMLSDVDILVHDPNVQESSNKNVSFVDFKEVVSADSLIIATPAQVLEEVLTDVASELDRTDHQPLIVDISSMKQYPQQLFDKVLPEHNEVLLCHPLFGPQSAKHTLLDKVVIVTETKGQKAANLLARWQLLGLRSLYMSAEEHDRQMVSVQVIPFLLGALASNTELITTGKLVPFDLQTPSYQSMRQLSQLNMEQSDDLLDSILKFNPGTEQILAEMQLVLAGIASRMQKQQ